MKKRNNALDLWKFIFAVIIVCFHGKNVANGEVPYFIGGSIGVEFFFIVSGMLMANSASRNQNTDISLGKDTFQFMKKKIMGLLPNVYVAWVIAFIVEHFGRFKPYTLYSDFRSAVWELLFVTDTGLMGYRANGVTWYISAMLIAMLILYPLMRRYKDVYFCIIAPLIILFTMGITCQSWTTLGGPHVWNGFVYKGLVRAIISLAIGSVGYKISMKMKDIEFTTFAKLLLTIVEFGMYGYVIAYNFSHPSNRLGWLFIVMLACAVVITFSQVDLFDQLFSKMGVLAWFGEFSFSLYLGHGYWSHQIKGLMPNATYNQRFVVYWALAIITGLFIMYVSKAISAWWGKHKESITSKLIKKS